MELTILGCHSATPRNNARPTAQLLEMRGHLFLIDCGEATQIALRNANAKFSRIKHIFISHLHGDHFFGLFGLISTFQLLGREAEMHIYGPKGIKEAVLLVLKLGGAYTPFPLYFHELSGDTSEVLYEDDKVLVRTIPLRHRVYTNGFFFLEKEGERRLDMTAISNYPSIEKCDYQNIKNGKDVVLENGTIIPNEELTFAPHKPQSYAFCSDTRYLESIIPIIEGVDLLYHEATFLDDLKDLAKHTGHSTAIEAAIIAEKAKVKKLILGHFSNRYTDYSVFLEEAKVVFKNAYLPKALERVEIN